MMDFKNYTNSSKEVMRIMEKGGLVGKLIDGYYEGGVGGGGGVTEVRIGIAVEEGVLQRMLGRLKGALE